MSAFALKKWHSSCRTKQAKQERQRSGPSKHKTPTGSLEAILKRPAPVAR